MIILRGHFPVVVGLAERENAQAVAEQALDDAADGVDATDNGAHADQEAWDTLQAHCVLDSDRRQFVAEEDCWHAALGFDGLRGSESESFECLRWLVAWVIVSAGFVHEVNLADFQEVVNEQTVGSHEVHHTWSHELVLINLATVQLKVEFFAKVLFDVLYVTEVAETEMVDFMREVQAMTLHVQSLDGLWIVMATDMEITWNLVDEYKAAKLASFLVVQTIDCLIKDLLSLSLTGLWLKEMLFGYSLSIYFGVSTVFDMLDGTDLISVLVKSIFVKLTLNVDEMNTSHIDNIKTQDGARTFWKSNVKVDVQFFFPWIDINHDVTLFLVLYELIGGLSKK